MAIVAQMPRRRVVREGECLAQIAAEYGFAPETIWSAPDNQELATSRRNYNVLAAGDVLIIPDKQPERFTGATDRRHSFRRKGVPAKLRLQLYDGDSPRANLAYELRYGAETLTGVTTADGVLEHWFPAGVRSVILRVADEPDVTIEIGGLDPLDSVRGAQQRLRNLGYECPTKGEFDGATAEAICLFQTRHGLELTGSFDATTLAELERLHDSTAHPGPPPS